MFELPKVNTFQYPDDGGHHISGGTGGPSFAEHTPYYDRWTGSGVFPEVTSDLARQLLPHLSLSSPFPPTSRLIYEYSRAADKYDGCLPHDEVRRLSDGLSSYLRGQGEAEPGSIQIESLILALDSRTVRLASVLQTSNEGKLYGFGSAACDNAKVTQVMKICIDELAPYFKAFALLMQPIRINDFTTAFPFAARELNDSFSPLRKFLEDTLKIDLSLGDEKIYLIEKRGQLSDLSNDDRFQSLRRAINQDWASMERSRTLPGDTLVSFLALAGELNSNHELTLFLVNTPGVTSVYLGESVPSVFGSDAQKYSPFVECVLKLYSHTV